MGIESELPILTKEKKEELIDDVERNGGRVLDPDFKTLEEYLERNPLDRGAITNLKGAGGNN
jgi:hypothetical protein